MKHWGIKLVPQLDRSEFWRQWAQTVAGKLFLVAVFSGLMFLHGISLWWVIAIYLILFSMLPQFRWWILIGSTWSFIFIGPTDFQWGRISKLFHDAGIPWQIDNTFSGLPIILFAILTGSVYVFLSKQYQSVFKRPIFSLILLFLSLMLVASYAPMPAVIRPFLWSFLVVFGQFFWFICFSIKERKAPQPIPQYLHLGQYLPFWEPTVIPYPKGVGYLKKIEAKNSEEFAVCQLKGLKLLLWALWLKVFALFMNVIVFGYDEFFYGRLQFKRELATINLFFDGRFLKELVELPFAWQLPRYETALNMAVNGVPFAWYINWQVLIVDFLYFILYVAFSTHIIIAIIRMSGFNALRNTYKPLASKTIAEFWNRYFYYFKELLVEMFFYPTFFRYFKKNPRLRMYMATMAAAFFGNFLFHFMRDIWFVIELGFFEAMLAFHSYFIYSFILGNVIFLSQWRQENKSQAARGRLSRYWAPIPVLGFYCLLTVLVDFRRESITDNLAFLLSLLPL